MARDPAIVLPDTYYIYILVCRGGRLYTGYTDDMVKRITAHCGGRKGARFTRSFKPEAVARYWAITADKGSALKIEQFIKSRNRRIKELFVEKPGELKKALKKETGLHCDMAVSTAQQLRDLNHIIKEFRGREAL